MKFFVLVVVFCLANISFAKNTDLDFETQKRVEQSAAQFFENQDLVEITIKADFSALREDRDRTSNEYHPAEVFWNDNGDTIHIPTKLKTRGNFRLKCENCDFPPLRLKFKPKAVFNTIFEGQEKLKLVTHCRDTSEMMQQTMLREYLVYKMYNVVSDNSLRVRLISVNYVDVITGDELKRYAFFIESKEQMAERLGMEEIEMVNLKQQQLLVDNIIQLALFNYLIGNTDWSIPKLHNVALLRHERHSPPIAVPFDFDMSEFVDACYMKVYMGRELLENRYKGIKVPMETLARSLEYYKDKKPLLTDVILDFDYLNIEDKQQCLKLLDSFYKIIENKQASKRAFIAEARK